PSRLSSVPCTVVATTASGSISYSCTMPLPPRSTLFPYTTLFRSGGMLSISADGNKAGTGILWALVPLNGDANQQRGVRAQLLAFAARDIKKDIWRSEPLDASFGPNSVGLFAKFVPPTVANGKVFVATYGDHENPPGPIRYWQQNVPPPG